MRELNVDWHALHSAFQMNMPEVRCFLDLTDGKVLKLPATDPQLPAVRAESQRYAAVEAIPSRIQYQWLDEFVATVDDEPTRGRMQAAINGKGAFRRFKDILLTAPEERRRWFEFRDQKMRRRIVEWVREVGIEATSEPPWLTAESTDPNKPKEQNSANELDALRDFIIDWADGQKPQELAAPINLERLAHAIGERFRVRPL